MWKVEGKRRDIVATGPIPGSTPIKVPISTPRKQKNKLFAWNVTANANWRFVRRSKTKALRFLWVVEFLTTVQILHRKERKPGRFLRSPQPTFGVQCPGKEKLIRGMFPIRTPRFPERWHKPIKPPKPRSNSSISLWNTRSPGHLLICSDEPVSKIQWIRLPERCPTQGAKTPHLGHAKTPKAIELTPSKYIMRTTTKPNCSSDHISS